MHSERLIRQKTIMVQGTTSAAGKTTIAAGLCRIFSKDGYKVSPFKAWNMGLNSRITPDGGEMGAGQYIQAEAAGIFPTVDMQPILLKPEANGKPSQIIIRGKVASPEDVQMFFPTNERRKIIKERIDIRFIG